MKDLDYQALGFQCGLEIHQQLDTRKLFSPCPSDTVEPDEVPGRTNGTYHRRLRSTQSELGEMDPAAIAEAKRRRAFTYLSMEGLSSLVELDEEPPHPMSEDALDVALTYAGLLDSRPADEVHIMRKTVIDGSNTSGFQRTALVATGGTVDPDGYEPVGIWTIAVEEDSARKYSDDGGATTFTLDRLGIPLIEVATAPTIKDPKHAQATAARLGALLRATGRVKRGLGTIRQDLNVSIGVGDRVEIKGCQDLRSVPQVIETEVRRQLWLHEVATRLQERGFKGAGDIHDVSSALADCPSKIIQGALKKGGKVLALHLPHWDGLMRGASKDGPRYGREFADHAKVAAGVKGVFHSDELPAYGIEAAEVTAIRALLPLGDQDGFVLCVEKEPVARAALEAVAACADDAPRGAGRAVRAAQPDHSTRYMRPLPGAARMYPETDVPPIRIDEERRERILSTLPLRPEEVVAQLQATGISQDQAGQIVRDGTQARFQAAVDAGLDAGTAARILLQFLPDLASPDAVMDRLGDVATALQAGAFAKEALPDVLAALDKDPGQTMEAAVQSAGAGAADEGAVIEVVQRIVQERLEFVQTRGMGSMGPLMGPVMAELRGKADGAVISKHLQAAIEEVLS